MCLLGNSSVHRSLTLCAQNGKYTALIMACRSQQVDVVNMLLDLGARINQASEVRFAFFVLPRTLHDQQNQ